MRIVLGLISVGVFQILWAALFWGITEAGSLSQLEIAKREALLEAEIDRLCEASEIAAAQINEWIAIYSRSERDDTAFYDRAIERRDAIIQSLNLFLKENPKNTRALMCLADFYEAMGDEQAAFSRYEGVRKIDRRNAYAWNNLANIYGHRGEAKKAFQYYRRSIRLNSEVAIFFQNYATTVFLFRKDAKEFFRENEQEVFDRAIDLYREAMKRDTDNLFLAQDFASSFEIIKPYRVEMAIEAWVHVLDLATKQSNHDAIDDARNHIARFEVRRGRFEEAKRILSQFDMGTGASSANLITKEKILKTLERKANQE